MIGRSKLTSCGGITWMIAVLAGAVMFKLTFGLGWLIALLFGLVFAALVGIALTRGFCSGTAVNTVPIPESGTQHEATPAPGVGASYEAVDTEADTQPAGIERSSTAQGVEPVPPVAAADNVVPDDAVEQPVDHVAKAVKAVDGDPEQSASGEPTPDYDGDGELEGADEGVRPAGLSAPRDGKADDLKLIKGIGPKLEELCHELGFYHFEQIANWSDDEVAWVNANLTGFKGRVTRDDWVEQAKILAAGGSTEFAQRVEDGDVY